MACQIRYNTQTEKYEVTAPNGQESILYKTISELPETTSDSMALRQMAVVYTKTFKDWYGTDWETLSEKERQSMIDAGYLDQNGEPAILYRGDYDNLETFNYSETVGKFGQGIYLAQNKQQAESFAAETGKKVYPVFIKPGNSVNFKSVTAFKQKVADFNNIKTVPSEADVQNYVEYAHSEGITIIGNGVMGKEFNVPSKENVKSIFNEGIQLQDWVYFDNTDASRQFMTEEYQQGKKSDRVLEEFISRMANNLGMDYANDVKQVSADEAQLITQDAKNPYNGQAAFFYKGKVYFVKGKVNYKTAFHEFSHPFVRAIQKENPELFNKILSDLVKTNEGAAFMAEAIEEYPDLDANDPLIAEEVVVKALTEAAQQEGLLEPQASAGFMGAIKKILYALRQLMRKLTGGKSVSKLAPSTSMGELANMVVDKSWNIELDNVTEDDVAAYMQEMKDYAEDMQKFHESKEGRAAIHRNIKENIRITREQLKQMRASGQEEDIKIVLSDKTGRFDLDAMQENLAKFTTKAGVTRAYNERIDELAEFESRIDSLLFNMDLIDKSVDRMQDYIQNDLQDEPDQRKALGQVTFYKNTLDDWANFVNQFQKDAERAKIPAKAPIMKDMAALEKRIKSGQDSITEIYKNAVQEALFEYWEPMNQGIRDDVKRRVDAYTEQQKGLDKTSRKYQVLEARIEEAKKDLERVVDKKEFLDYIVGNMGDIGTAHAWLENYISNQDPSISSFAAYIKKHMSDISVETHQGYNEFVTGLEPLLSELGIKPSQIDKFADQFLFKDTTTKRNEETHDLESYDVYTFLNEHKNYKLVMAQMNERINNAEIQYELERNDETREEYVNAVAEKEEHMRLFFHQVFVDDFYDADNVLDETELGKEARRQKESIMDEINYWEKSHRDKHELHEDYETVEELWRQYKQLHSLYDDYGQLKKGDDLKIAELLRAHREAKSKFYKYSLREGYFETSYGQFKQKEKLKLIKEGYQEGTATFDEEFELRKDTWLKYNTQLKITPDFYETRQKIMDKIKTIMNELDSDFDANIDTILNSLQGKRDRNGQPIGTEMTEEHLQMIKDIEQANWNAKQDIEGISGLTPNERGELSSYYERFQNDEKLDPTEYKRFKALQKKQEEKGLDKGKKQTLISLFAALENLQTKQATDYYLEIVNNYYRDIKRADGVENPKTIDHSNVHLFSKPSAVDPILEKDENFKKWFWENHIEKTKFNSESGKMELVYERTYAWSITRPKSDKYLEKTEIKDETGQVTETIIGVPSMKYYKREVKDEYKTGYNPKTGKVELEVGKHISTPGMMTPDLPKGLADMTEELNRNPERFAKQDYAYDYYINHDYVKLREEGGARFKALEYIKDFHLKHQEKLERHARLGLELPRYRRDLYEYVSGKPAKDTTKDIFGRIVGGFTQLWGKRKDDFEDGLNFDDQMLLVNADMHSNQNTKVPITGKYYIEADQVSRDITTGILNYYQSSMQNKKLREIQPVAKAFQKLATDQNPLDIKKITKMSMEQRAGKPMIRTKTNNRGKVINSMVETFFEGKKLFDNSNSPVAVKLINNSLSMASHAFFAFDVTSAMKNFLGAQFQIALEGAGSKYFDYKEWQRGRPWANKAMWEISAQVYKDSAKSLNVQMIEIFDAVQGRFEEKFGESLSRSFRRDAANLSWTTTHRKWLETEATLQLFSAIMHSTKIEQTQPDGSTKKIRYIDAWEVDPETKKIKLKEGIDASWDIGGKNFDKIKFKNHEVSNFLQGAYANMDQPMVSRYMLWRLVSSMRKYFTKMFLHRYGGSKGKGWWDPQERYNLGTGQMHMGFYARNWQTFRKLAKDPRNARLNLMTMTKDEARAMKMGLLELVKLQLLTMSYFWLWGYDPEDEDRWKKRKGEMDTDAFFQGSGALPWFGLTDEEWSENWNMQGWVGNQLLLLAMHVEAENEHFIPWFGYGAKDILNVFSESSIASGPSVMALFKLGEDVWDTMMGDDGQYYSKDVGALNIQQEGQNKFWRHLYQMGGIKGKFIDPTTSIKNFQGARERD